MNSAREPIDHAQQHRMQRKVRHRIFWRRPLSGGASSLNSENTFSCRGHVPSQRLEKIEGFSQGKASGSSSVHEGKKMRQSSSLQESALQHVICKVAWGLSQQAPWRQHCRAGLGGHLPVLSAALLPIMATAEPWEVPASCSMRQFL